MLDVRNLTKEFDGQVVLNDVSLRIEKGERIAILGPSGSGKSTLLNCISGILSADSGSILWDNVDLRNKLPHQRQFGFMFQEYALFPHMNVGENICFGLAMADVSKELQQKRLEELLILVGLEGFEKRSVQQLSGGERQRVALARSLAPAPKLLLLDEPLGALDRSLRENLLLELQTILKDQTVIFVTHDQTEAFQLADRVYVMNEGKIVQFGTPIKLLEEPNSVFVAEFLGYDNVFKAEYDLYSKKIKTIVGEISSDLITEGKYKIEESFFVLLKSHCLTLNQTKDDANALYVAEGRIDSVEFHGKMMRLKIAVNDSFVFVDEPIHLNHFSKGELVTIWMIDRKAVVLFNGNH